MLPSFRMSTISNLTASHFTDQGMEAETGEKVGPYHTDTK